MCRCEAMIPPKDKKNDFGHGNENFKNIFRNGFVIWVCKWHHMVENTQHICIGTQDIHNWMKGCRHMIQTHLHNPAISFAAKTHHAFHVHSLIKIAI